jgi:hypothetical protein
MDKSSISINIFVSHPFEPKNSTYDLEKFRTNIKLLITKAESNVRKYFPDFEIETTFEFSDLFEGLPQQIESKIRSSHLAIVDITENRPNIFFEYGLLYGLNIPVVMIKSRDSMDTFKIPADLKDRLPQVYKDFDSLTDNVVAELTTTFKKLLKNDSLYNIYLKDIWFPNDVGTIHVITSTEPDRRKEFSSPDSQNYMFLESLGDKDSLLEIMNFLNRNYRNVNIQMYAADEFPRSNIEDNLVIIGGPGDDEGDGNPICKIMMEKMKLKISYSEDCETLLYNSNDFTANYDGNRMKLDYGYFARFPNPFNNQKSVILVNGIHTYGVLGAAKIFSDHPLAQSNIKTLMKKLNLDDHQDAAFESFFPVEVLEHTVVCPTITESNIILL